MKQELSRQKWFKNRLLIFAVTPLIIVLAAFSTYVIHQSHRQPYYELEYIIRPLSAAEKTLSVTATIKPYQQSEKNYFSFIKNAPITAAKCHDSSNKAIHHTNKDGIIRIGPFSKKVDYSYTVTLGQPGKLGCQGAIYNDLLTFSGENVILFPYFDSEYELNQMDRIIRKLSVQVNVKDDWDLVMPYQTVKGQHQNRVVINKPDWISFFNLGKSCFASGKFEKIIRQRKIGNLEILLDPALKEQFTPMVEKAIGNLYDFYANLFGEGLRNYPMILLRQDPQTRANIIGGVGGESMGFSFNPEQEDDWRSLSHSMYHAFFDSKVKARNLHFPPYLWLYRGLATHYENQSINALPSTIKTKFDFHSDDEYRNLYNRYIYFRLTEPSLFMLMPLEETNFYQAQAEFMDYTQGPLIISAIEHLSAKAGKPHPLLRFVLRHAGDKSINIKKALVEALGSENRDFTERFIAGKEWIPFLGLPDQVENPDRVVKKLNEFQFTMFSWFHYENIPFPYEPIVLLRPDDVIKETNLRGLKFGSDPLEKTIQSYSPTLFVILRQQALRANVCGLSFPDPKLRLKLMTDPRNLSKWKDFLTLFLGRNIRDEKEQSHRKAE